MASPARRPGLPPPRSAPVRRTPSPPTTAAAPDGAGHGSPRCAARPARPLAPPCRRPGAACAGPCLKGAARRSAHSRTPAPLPPPLRLRRARHSKAHWFSRRTSSSSSGVKSFCGARARGLSAHRPANKDTCSHLHTSRVVPSAALEHINQLVPKRLVAAPMGICCTCRRACQHLLLVRQHP